MPLRRHIYHNPSARSWAAGLPASDANVKAFQKQLPGYTPTRLVSLDAVAREIHVRAVYVKDESSRLGLPSFKILGAAWGTFRAVAQRLDLSLTASLEQVRAATARESLSFFAATDGNHGRAVARMASILGVKAEVFVPTYVHPKDRQLIESEGAKVTLVNASYDDVVQTAYAEAKKAGGILVQDTAFGNYEEIPRWLVEGYQTLLAEVDEQLSDKSADLVIAPVGVGSFAQAVVSHYKASGRSTRVVTVEPDTAASLWKSLVRGKVVPIETHPTIMAGMNCGTVSSIAWPILQNGVDSSVTVSDYEAYQAARALESHGVSAGPCGAAPLAALRRLIGADRSALGIDENSIVVLLSTEGPRDYGVPRDVSPDDTTSLTQALIQINSVVPGSGTVAGPGETEIADYVFAWLEHRDVETHWVESTPGRPSVVGVARGTGGGKALMINGHIDTVSSESYEGDPFSGMIKNGRLYGHGSANMKAGVAASLLAVAEARRLELKGDVVFIGVAGEEAISIGTGEVLDEGWRADAAVICAPVDEKLIVTNRGFIWIQVNIHGVAAHGSLSECGIDAITHVGYFLAALDQYSNRLMHGPKHPLLGPPSVHASIMNGGEEPSHYPIKCIVTLERWMVPGESSDSVKAEVEALLEETAAHVEDFSYDVQVTCSRHPFAIEEGGPFVALVADQILAVTGRKPPITGLATWTDAALLSSKGIDTVLYGPKGEGFYGIEESVELTSIETVHTVLIRLIKSFCEWRFVR